jgi:hypothetical protein
MVNKKEKTYWPHMIVGFIMMGVTLGYWTIKSASLMPVQESNNLMQKYQMVDININDILIKREAFDRKFKIDLTEVKRIVVTDNIYSKRVQENPVELMVGENSFNFIINSKNNSNIEILNNAKISFLLTRPHTRVDDILIKDIPSIAEIPVCMNSLGYSLAYGFIADPIISLLSSGIIFGPPSIGSPEPERILPSIS